MACRGWRFKACAQITDQALVLPPGDSVLTLPAVTPMKFLVHSRSILRGLNLTVSWLQFGSVPQTSALRRAQPRG
eukprot:11521923-Karenia_brevis.AAC.1